MRISEIITRRHTVDLRSKGLSNPRFDWTEKTILLVFVVTESGAIGVGEAWMTGGSPSALESTIKDDLAPLLLGKDARLIERHWQTMHETILTNSRYGIVQQAIAGIDIALWDLLGKITRTPCYVLLGGSKDRVYAYASAGLYAKNKTLDDLSKEAQSYLEVGFTGMKMKVGGASQAEDVARVAAVREVLGPQGRLMIDAFGRMSLDQALQFAEAVRPYNIYWFEQPVNYENFDGMRRINDTALPVAGNENMSNLLLFHHMIEAEAVRFVQPDLLIVGGISGGRKICSMAAEKFLDVTLHNSSSAVLMAANLHLAAGLQNVESIEYHQIHNHLHERAPEELFRINEGWIHMTDQPGLGLDFAPDDFPG